VNKKITLDVRNLPVGMREFIEYWETYVTVTSDLPDEILMTTKQKMVYLARCINLFDKMGVEIPQDFIDNPNFRGIPVRCSEHQRK